MSELHAVFVVQHAHQAEQDEEDVKLIGVYTSAQKAAEAVSRLRQVPGFSSSPDGFSIDEYELDLDHWAEGFVTVEPFSIEPR